MVGAEAEGESGVAADITVADITAAVIAAAGIAVPALLVAGIAEVVLLVAALGEAGIVGAVAAGMSVGGKLVAGMSVVAAECLQVGDNDYSLYGQEMNGSIWALCRMNILVHNKDAAGIEWGDTIGSPKLIEKDALMEFDVVVANPPFSLDKWGAEAADADKFHRFHRGVPPKSKGDYAFITHIVEIAVEGTARGN